MTTIIETISMEAELNCATMKSTIPSVLRNGQTTMLQLSVTTSATHPHPIVSIEHVSADLVYNSTPKTGAQATGEMTFGQSEVVPLDGNLMCNGTEYTLSECPGYELVNATSEDCLSGLYQAGVRCIQGISRIFCTLSSRPCC